MSPATLPGLIPCAVAGLALMSPTMAICAAVDHMERIGCWPELAAGSALCAASLGLITHLSPAAASLAHIPLGAL